MQATSCAVAARTRCVDPALVLQHDGSKRDGLAIAAHRDAGSSADDVADHLREVVDIQLDGVIRPWPAPAP